MNRDPKRQRMRPKGGPEGEIRAEEVLSIHDEVDVMQFRNIATARFMRNQELLEMVLERQVPLANIQAPSAFPPVPQQPMAPEDDVWFGDLARVKQRLAEVEAETESWLAQKRLRASKHVQCDPHNPKGKPTSVTVGEGAEQPEGEALEVETPLGGGLGEGAVVEQASPLFGPEFAFQRKCLDSLGDPLAKEDLNAIELEYRQRFGKRITGGVQRRSMPHLNGNTAVAPEGYVAPGPAPAAPQEPPESLTHAGEMFGNVDIMMDDAFGTLQSTLDDDFLSEINQNME